MKGDLCMIRAMVFTLSAHCCSKLGFDFVGIEINEQYYQDQEQRFNKFILP